MWSYVFGMRIIWCLQFCLKSGLQTRCDFTWRNFANLIFVYRVFHLFIMYIEDLGRHEDLKLHYMELKTSRLVYLFLLSKQKKKWICSLFKEWILERVKLEWIWSEFGVNICVIHSFGVTTGITRNPWVILRSLQNEWITQNVHSKFTLIFTLF